MEVIYNVVNSILSIWCYKVLIAFSKTILYISG